MYSTSEKSSSDSAPAGGSPFWAKLHAIAGLAAFAAFLVTGLYLKFHAVHLLPDATRLLYRSRHIYLLMAALLNLLVGVQYREVTSGRVTQQIGSTLILVAPALLFAAFFLDPQRADLNTPLSQLAIYSIFAGSILLAWVNRKHAAWR